MFLIKQEIELDIYILTSSTNAQDIKQSENYPIVKGLLSKPISLYDIKSIIT